MQRVLLTTTSFQDTPGPHHQLLASAGFEVATARGPLPEAAMLDLVGDADGLLCGDDAITRAVLRQAQPRLKVISKYGIGLDKIDLQAATELRIPVCFCPGVNHASVAEHTFMLMLALAKNLIPAVESTRQGGWTRQTGMELHGKTLGIVGLGRVGQEVARRAEAFGMERLAFGRSWDDEFAQQHQVRRAATLDELLAVSDVITLHTRLTPATRGLINVHAIAKMKPGALLINCARGEIVNSADLARALDSHRVGGYGADVLDAEPPPSDHPLLHCPNCLITPHLASRTRESVVRQATMAVQNLVAVLQGAPPLAQANSFDHA